MTQTEADRRARQSERDKAIRLLSRDEVLALLKISYPALWAWVRDKKFPAGLSIGSGKRGHVMWNADEVEAWILSRPRRIPKAKAAA
jgi:predicted DNA-binding transcriptional regulator AlpA